MKLTIENKNGVWNIEFKNGETKIKETLKNSEVNEAVVTLLKSEVADAN